MHKHEIIYFISSHINIIIIVISSSIIKCSHMMDLCVWSCMWKGQVSAGDLAITTGPVPREQVGGQDRCFRINYLFCTVSLLFFLL